MGSRRVSPAISLTDSLQSVGMAEELRFQLEMKRLELEAEERREARRLEIEAASEAKRLELEVRRLEVEKEEAEKNRDFELERSRIGANSSQKGGGEGEGNSV